VPKASKPEAESEAQQIASTHPLILLVKARDREGLRSEEQRIDETTDGYGGGLMITLREVSSSGSDET